MNGGARMATRGEKAPLLALALGASCMLAFSRAFAAGFGSALPFVNSHDAATIALTCSTARVMALIALVVAAVIALLQSTHSPRPDMRAPSGGTALASGIERLVARPPLAASAGAGVLLVLAVAALALDVSSAASILAAVVAGVATGCSMLMLMLAMARRSFREIVGVALASLLVGGLLIMGLMRLPALPATVLLALAGAGMAVLPAVVGRCGEPDAARGPERQPGELLSYGEAFPWFPAVMFAASGISGSMLYGAAVALGWNTAGYVNYPLMGCAIVAVVGITALFTWWGSHSVKMLWVPQFALLMLALVLASFADASVNPTVMGLLMASVFSYHFLRWMVFPAIVRVSRAPRMLACALILLVTSSFLNVNSGGAIAQALPAGLQLQGGLVAIVALVFVVAFAAAFVVERTRHERLWSEAPQVFDETLEETLQEAMASYDAQNAASSDALEERCAQLARQAGLTPREAEILLLTARGHSSTYIAEQLVVSANTVRFHQKNIYRKLEVHDRQALLALVNS